VKLSDLTVEVRDKGLNRIGQIRHEDLTLEASPLFNNVGSWILKLPSEHHLLGTLKTPGAGIIVTGPNDVLFSGPVTTPTFESSPTDPAGSVTFEGITDEVILLDALSFPQPSNPDPTTQNEAHDIRTGNAESLLHAYVNANIGPGAPAARRKANLIMGTNGNRGPTIKKSPRFPVLGNLLSDIALVGKLGFRVVQRDDKLVFETFEIVDRTALIRLDALNGQLAAQTVSIQSPTATRVLVAGQNEGVDRQFIERTTTESLAAEVAWGRRIERFLDQRQTSDVGELEGAGDEVLEEEGFTSIAVKAVPADDSTMTFGTDWNLGDKVTVVVDGGEVAATVSGMVMKVNSDGFRLGVVIGDLSGATGGSRGGNKMQTLEDRIAHLEQNAETTAKVVLDDTYAPKDAMPLGAVISYAGSSAPTGWHLCDGSAHGSAALQALIGSANAPNLRDRFIVGAGSGYAVGNTGGADSVTLTAAQSGVPAHSHATPAHSHTINHDHAAATSNSAGGHVHGGYANNYLENVDVAGSGRYVLGQEPYTANTMATAGAHTHTVDIASFSGTSGTAAPTTSNNSAANASAAHENRPPYYALTYIIKKV
jgi:microcystin-dependent protein